jgi:hypothetical protein
MNNKIKVPRKKERQGELSTIAQCVIEKMENNPDFPDPPVALAMLKEALPEFRIALANAHGRDRIMMSIKDDKKKIVLNLLAELAEYVAITSKGDRTLILSSGFDVADENRGMMTPAIEILDVELGPPGEATTRIKNVTAAIAYMHQYATEPPGANTVWTSVGSCKGYYTFRGLQSDKRYWFRVIAIGRVGNGNSPVVTRVIQ